MGQETDSDKNLVDDLDIEDEEWDDFEDDLDSFEDDLSFEDEQVNASSDAAPAKKTKKIKEKKIKKKSGSGFIMSFIALATLGSVSWLALSSNPQLMSTVIGMTTGKKHFDPPKITLDPQETVSEPVTNLQENPSVQTTNQMPLVPGMPNVPTAQTQDDTVSMGNLDDTVPPIDIAPDEDVTMDTASQANDILTPFPDLSALRNVEPPVALDSIDDPGAAPENSQPFDLTADTNASPIDSNKPNLEIIETPENTSNNLILEENALLEQTDKTFNEIESVPPVILAEASPVVPIVQAEAIDVETIPSEIEIVPADPITEDIEESVADPIPALDTPVKQPENPVQIKIAQEIEPPENKVAAEEKLPTPIKMATPQKVEPPAQKNPAPEKPVRLPAWELRSAGSGTALIHDKTSGNVLSIGVGSTVKGIGRIKSIEKRDGKWIVVGTTGSIRQ